MPAIVSFQSIFISPQGKTSLMFKQNMTEISNKFFEKATSELYNSTLAIDKAIDNIYSQCLEKPINRCRHTCINGEPHPITYF